MSDVTRILNAIEQGDARATNKLLPLVYEELRFLAAKKMAREKPGQTLQATALVHEAYLRLVEGEGQNWKSRRHFFKAASEAMRRLLVENARRKGRLKRGGDKQRVSLDDVDLTIDAPSDDVVALDTALTKLAEEKPTMVEVIELRYFAGLNLEQISEILGVSRRTVSSYWSYSRAWLYREMTSSNARPS
ncbi:MAG: sigma-70 family RNA polymerase sigma factor [Planctomycetota bacterium]|jgi:RNA polymerase sigma factor (TIGR02999 family)